MRSILVILAVLMTGCSSTKDWLLYSERRGYAHDDPCVRCGEKWLQVPNERFEAQKRYARGERW